MIVGGVAAAAAVVGVIILVGIIQKELPPTGFGPGHSEQFPPTQINSAPIPRAIQEHVMERGGRSHREGSMLIQYNCFDYECEPGLIDELIKIVEPYHERVYLAPYPTMDAKIALAAPGRLETLDSFDEARIRKFIEDNLKR